MEQYFIWYTLQLKAWMKRKTSWLLTVGIFIIIFLVSHIHIPSAENTQIGICISEDPYGKRMISTLDSMNSVFDFYEYPEKEKLISDVEAGILECGFILAENFEECVQNDQFENAITYLCTPLTTKGTVAKETIFASYLQLYGEMILQDSESVIYSEENPEVTQMLLDKYQYYLENSRLLQMNTEYLNVKNTDDLWNYSSKEVYPIQGIAGILLLLMLWLEGGKKFENNGNSVCAALDIRRSSIFQYCGYLASVTIPAAAAWLSILLWVKNRGFINELISLVIFILLTSCWGLLAGKYLKRNITYIAGALTIVLVQGLICPVFVDLAAYFPALAVIRMIFPLSWYLI